MDAVERVEAWLAHLKHCGYGDEHLVSESMEVSAGDLRTLLALARSNRDADREYIERALDQMAEDAGWSEVAVTRVVDSILDRLPPNTGGG